MGSTDDLRQVSSTNTGAGAMLRSPSSTSLDDAAVVLDSQLKELGQVGNAVSVRAQVQSNTFMPTSGTPAEGSLDDQAQSSAGVAHGHQLADDRLHIPRVDPEQYRIATSSVLAARKDVTDKQTTLKEVCPLLLYTKYKHTRTNDTRTHVHT